MPAAVWRSFLIRRGIRLLVLPTMLGLLTAVARQDLALPAWSIVGVTLGSAVLWLPTSVWMGWARFLRPRDDDAGLLIATGEVVDRAAFMHLVAARSVEVGLVLLAMWGMAALFLITLGWLWALPVMLTCVVVTGWGGVRLRTQVWTARAAVALAGGRAAQADEAVRYGLGVRTGRRTGDTLVALGVVAKLRLGQREAAIKALDRLQDPAWMNMDVVAATLHLEDGVAPHQDLTEEVPNSLVRALALTQLQALNALYADRPAEALVRLGACAEARTWLPRQQVITIDLLVAASQAAAGDLAAARASLIRSRTLPSERAWIGAAHPRWGAWLDAIGGSP